METTLRDRIRAAIAGETDPALLPGLEALTDRVLVAIVENAPQSNRRIMDRVEIQEGSTNGQWRVRVLSSNGDLILWSEQYGNRSWADRVASELGLPVTVSRVV